MVKGYQLWLIFLFLVSVSFIFTEIIKRLSLQYGIVDLPGKRRSHDDPTPRGGGMAIVIVFLLFLPILRKTISGEPNVFWGFYLSSLFIALLGFFDDLTTLSRNKRMIGWIFISIFAMICGISIKEIHIPLIGRINFGYLFPLVTFLWLIGLTNFYNFMDGINGMAAFEALVVSGFLGIISFFLGNRLIYLTSALLFGSVLGFLPHNFPRAKIFMGDGASNFLGFVLASLAVVGSQGEKALIPFLVPVILLMMFLLDAGTTLIKRLPQGKDWLEPHRDHLYQRLIKLGYSHTQVTIGYTICNILLAWIAIQYLYSDAWVSGVYFVLSFVPFLGLLMFAIWKENSL